MFARTFTRSARQCVGNSVSRCWRLEHTSRSAGREKFVPVLNQQQYPDLSCPELIEQCQKQLHTEQTCILSNFLDVQVSKDILRFAKDELKNVKHPGINESNVYYQEPDNTYPTGHPQNRLVTRSNTYITADRIPQDMPLRQLQDSSRFTNFLCAVTGHDLREYECSVSKFVFSCSGAGDHQDWVRVCCHS